MGSEIQNKQDQTTIAAIIINKQADQQPHSPVHFQQSTQEIEIKQSRSSSLNLQKFPPLKLKHNPLDNHKLVCCTTTQEHRSVFLFLYFAKKRINEKEEQKEPYQRRIEQPWTERNFTTAESTKGMNKRKRIGGANRTTHAATRTRPLKVCNLAASVTPPLALGSLPNRRRRRCRYL